MIDVDAVYRNLTNVDIGQQKVLWDERGKGYYGEYLVFRELFLRLPGTCKLLMNVQVPAFYGKTTEIDLILLHETGMYVFEMKHYKGTIYGKTHERTWTQYFRTVRNQTFRNPVEQNQYHINSLRKILPDIPIYSYIVFTSDECDLRVECNEQDISVCMLSVLLDRLSIHTSRPAVMNMERIDSVFCTLLPYSPLTDRKVCIDEKEIPFYDYLSALTDDYKAKMGQLSAEYLDKVAKEQKACQQKVHQAEANAQFETGRAKNRIKTTIISAVAGCLICLILCIMVCRHNKKNYVQQILDLKQQIGLISDEIDSLEESYGIDALRQNSFISVTSASLRRSDYVDNAVSYTCTIRWNDSAYGVGIGKDAVLNMVLRDGTVKKCPVFNEQYPYTLDFLLGKGNFSGYYTYDEVVISPLTFYDVDARDVEFIVLSDVYLWQNIDNQPKVISLYQFEVFRAPPLS